MMCVPQSVWFAANNVIITTVLGHAPSGQLPQQSADDTLTHAINRSSRSSRSTSNECPTPPPPPPPSLPPASCRRRRPCCGRHNRSTNRNIIAIIITNIANIANASARTTTGTTSSSSSATTETSRHCDRIGDHCAIPKNSRRSSGSTRRRPRIYSDMWRQR